MNSQLKASLAGFLLAASSLAVAADVMTTNDGMTVYSFDKDPAGKSVCNGGCASTWIAVAPDAMKGKVDTITRDDGTKQAALKGKPLYRFASDKKPGDKMGDGMGGFWHAVGDSTSSASTPPYSGGY